MKLEELQTMWDEDCVIDNTQLGAQSTNIPYLHAKWRRLLSTEVVSLANMIRDQKQLIREKQECYEIGETKESREKGWEMPPRGKPIAKALIDKYTASDKDVLEMEFNVNFQKEKVDFVRDVLDSIRWRNAVIKNAIEDFKLKQDIDALKRRVVIEK